MNNTILTTKTETELAVARQSSTVRKVSRREFFAITGATGAGLLLTANTTANTTDNSARLIVRDRGLIVWPFIT